MRRNTCFRRRPSTCLSGEAGQTIIVVAIMLGLVLIGFVGLAVDYSNLWFHRQTAQGAADAACQAGAMNMLVAAQGNPTSTSGFTIGTDFDCSAASAAVPCKYAALNGYSGTGLTANAESNQVNVTFPGAITGITAPPSVLAGSFPYMRVDVVDRVRVYFSNVTNGRRTQDVRATAKCGLTIAKSPIPIIVLDPTDANLSKNSGSLIIGGTPQIRIKGGPTRSIQVNELPASSTSTPIIFNGSGALIDLSLAGPSGTGADLGVYGVEQNPCGVSPTDSCGQFMPGTTGHWITPSSPIPDPFAQLNPPGVPGTSPSPTAVGYGVNGCPDPDGCYEYTGGNYPSGICVGTGGCTFKTYKTAIFDPGIYYVTGGMSLAANSTARPSTATGDGTGGTMFYFSGSQSISVASNSGNAPACTPGTPPTPNGCVFSFATSAVPCPSGGTVSGLPTTVDGNILLAPCSGTYGDPAGQYRGMLFFQDRAGKPTGTNAPQWGGGGQFILGGTMYFHQCHSVASGDHSGTNCDNPPTAYNTVFTLQGNGSSGTWILGEIITDQLTLGGTTAINMQLSPLAAYNILKVSLFE